MKNVFEQLTDLLKKDERLVSQDDVLLKNQTQELARKNDPELIKLLLSDKAIKQHFFFEVEKTLIFDKEKFIRFISNKQFLPDSYTAFKNKIGLTAGDEYLSESKKVILAWPYKDCVLEGGMTKEDQKRDEIFYNETLAPDDINRLLDAKVFTNFKRIDKKGEHKLDGFKRDEKGMIKDNLIIKGNNLLALASLKKEFAGKVKLIYIDPPYNTELDSFSYNDNFSHSTWLTFMKNRLEIAKDLLTDDGTIFVQLDWHEAHYVKILMDYIFGRDYLINEIIWCYAGPGSPKMKQFNRKHDTIFWYKKGNNWTFNKDDIRIPYKDPNQSLRKAFDAGDGWTEEDLKILRERGKVPEDWWEFSVAARLRIDGKDRTGYLTEKPLKLMERIIKSASNEGDIILDFFAGAGTTGYVANKLKRQFILIEQLDDTQKKLKTRFENIDYVYMELAKWNEEWIEKIRDAKTGEELAKLWDEMKNTAFLSYKIDPKTIDSNVKDFAELNIADQKKFLIECLDKNNLYVNLSEIKDKEYDVSKEDIKLNKEFYE